MPPCSLILHVLLLRAGRRPRWDLGRAGSELHRARKEPTDTSHSRSPRAGSPRHGEYLSGFKNPVAFPIFIDLVPPAEAHHEPPSYVLGKGTK